MSSPTASRQGRLTSFLLGLVLTLVAFGFAALLWMWIGEDEVRDWKWWWVGPALVAIPWAWAITLGCRRKPWFAFGVGAGLPWVVLVAYIAIRLALGT